MIYIDPLQYYPETMIRSARARRYGNYWSHVWADSEEELRELMRQLKIPTNWLQHAGTRHFHIDVTPHKRELIIKAGAVEMTRRAYLKLHS